MANYPFVHIRQRVALGSELVKALQNKECTPEDVLFTLRKNGKTGVALRKLKSTAPIRYQNYALANEFLRGITKIGAGVYGEVFLGCIDQICKKEIAIKKGKCERGDVKKEFTHKELAANTVNALLSTTTDCKEHPISSLLTDCAEGNDYGGFIECEDGSTSCTYAEETIDKFLSGYEP